MAKDRVGQVSLGFFGRADAEAIRHLAAPKTRCGNMNHIQWPRFTPRLISARAIAYVPSCASTKRCRLRGHPTPLGRPVAHAGSCEKAGVPRKWADQRGIENTRSAAPAYRKGHVISDRHGHSRREPAQEHVALV
jgi:hypothetical protein